MKRTIIICAIVITTINLYWPARSVYKDYQKHLFLEQAEAEYREEVKLKTDTFRGVLRDFQPELERADADWRYAGYAENLRLEIVEIHRANEKEIEVLTRAIEKLRKEML